MKNYLVLGLLLACMTACSTKSSSSATNESKSDTVFLGTFHSTPTFAMTDDENVVVNVDNIALQNEDLMYEFYMEMLNDEDGTSIYRVTSKDSTYYIGTGFDGIGLEYYPKEFAEEIVKNLTKSDKYKAVLDILKKKLTK